MVVITIPCEEPGCQEQRSKKLSCFCGSQFELGNAYQQLVDDIKSEGWENDSGSWTCDLCIRIKGKMFGEEE